MNTYKSIALATILTFVSYASISQQSALANPNQRTSKQSPSLILGKNLAVAKHKIPYYGYAANIHFKGKIYSLSVSDNDPVGEIGKEDGLDIVVYNKDYEQIALYKDKDISDLTLDGGSNKEAIPNDAYVTASEKNINVLNKLYFKLVKKINKRTNQFLPYLSTK